MTLTRREMLQLTGWAGLGMVAPNLPRRAIAQDVDKPVGLALCIGTNHILPQGYAGWSISDLPGCENDARDMTTLLHQKGFYVHQLIGRDSNWANVSSWIRRAAKGPDPNRTDGGLIAGDTLIITTANHGAEIDDDNGDEALVTPGDTKDEVWCLYDQPVRDDNFNSLWQEFRKGVRIVVIADTCSSGTALRFAFALSDPAGHGMAAASSESVIDRQQRNQIEPLKRSMKWINRAIGISRDESDRRIAEFSRFVETRSGGGMRSASKDGVVIPDKRLFPVRALPNAVQRDVSQVAPASGVTARVAAATDVDASVMLISACKDWEEDQDFGVNGALTYLTKLVMASGFNGSYVDLAEKIATEARHMSLQQNPGHMTIGEDGGVFANLKAFNIA